MINLSAMALAVRLAFPKSASLPSSSNIVFNLKAESLALADNAAVSSWADTVNNLTFAGTGTFKTNQLGGKPCVRFNGSAGNSMIVARAGTALDTALASQVCTIMMVVKSAGTNSNGSMFGAHAGGNSCFMVMHGANTSCAVGRYAGNTTSMTAPAVNATGITVVAATSTKPYTIGSGSGMERVYLNGSGVASNVAPLPAPAQTNFSIGSDSNGTLRALVDIFDIVVWNSRLTDEQIWRATDYFYNKYNQTKPWSLVSNVVIYGGDSLTAGVGAGGTAGSYPYKSAQTLGLAYGQWTNVGVGGITASNMLGQIADWGGIGAFLGKGQRVAAFEYYNQRALSSGAIVAANAAYIAAVRALPNTKVVWGTTTGHSGDPDATRTAVNAYYEANPGAADGVASLHLNASIGLSTSYATNSATLWSDTVHFNGAGYTIVSDVMTPGIQALG